MANTREFDVVLFGATGYTGRLVAEHLVSRAQGARLALAGRNRGKLEALVRHLGESELPLLVGDSHDPAFVESLAQSSKVVCTTVGPYARYGAELVAACAQAGTGYCDLTGETQFIREMIDRHAATAERTGARIVHSCGFDSIPSDLGTFFLQEQAKAQLGGPCHRVKAFVTDMTGAISGGTIASTEYLLETAKHDPSLRALLFDPYSLNPENERQGPDGRDPIAPSHDPAIGWTAPFIMAVANTRIVRRSNAVMGYPYGRDFRYSETIATGRGVKGWAIAQTVTAVSAALMTSLAVTPLRKLTSPLRPKPGAGPSPQQRDHGHFTYEFHGQRHGAELFARVSAAVDPGYGAASRMLGESALCLAQDADRLPVQGGSWTPAAALGHALIARLNTVGITFRTVEN